MKNIISQSKFKKLYENKPIKNTLLFKDKLNESMDVSNGTGFSESLIGRAMNKIFSFVATRVEYAILGAQKKKYDDILGKAVTAAISLMNKSEELDDDIKIPEIKEIVSDTIKYSQTLNIEQGSTATTQIIKLFKLNDQQISSYKELEMLEKEILEEQNIKTLKEATVQTQTENVIEFVKSEDKTQNIKKQQETINSIISKIKIENLTDENKKMINVISDKLSTELENITDEQSKSELSKYKEELKNMSNLTDKLSEEEYKKRIEEYKNKSKQYYLKELEEKFKEITDLKAKNKIDNSTYKALVVFAHPDKSVNATDEEMKEKLKKIKEILKTKNITLETRKIINDYLDKLFESHLFEADIVPVKNSDVATNDTAVATTNNTAISNNTDTSNDNTDTSNNNTDTSNSLDEKNKILDEKIESFSKSLSQEQQESYKKTIYKKQKISSIYKIDDDDKKEVKKALTELKDKDVNNIDDFFDNLSDEEKSKFIELAKKSVNIEKIKVVGFKIEPLYNVENFEDKRNKLYDRVNFSTTTPDKKKIYNKWQIMISEVKAKYVKYFSIDGRFPNDYDPIKLINSDIKIRDGKEWEEYAKKHATDSSDGNNITTTVLSNKNLDLRDDQGEIMLYVFKLNGSDFRMGVLFRKIEIDDKIIGYFLLGMFNYNKIVKEITDLNKEKNSDDEEKIIKIVDKYHYTYEKNDEKGKKIYNIFRPYLGLTNKDDFAKIQTIFIRKNESMFSGNKRFIQASLYNNKIYISNFNKKQDEIVQSFFEIDNVIKDDSKIKSSNFYLTLKSGNSIKFDTNIWKKYIKNVSDNKLLLSKKNELNTIINKK